MLNKLAIAIVVVGFGLLGFATMSLAQEEDEVRQIKVPITLQCAVSAKALHKNLREKYGELQFGMGVDNAGAGYSFTFNPVNDSWSFIVMTAKYGACILATGEYFQFEDLNKLQPPAPQEQAG